WRHLAAPRFPSARGVLPSWQVDYNGVRPHSALANQTPQEFRSQHISAAASRANGQNFNPGPYLSLEGKRSPSQLLQTEPSPGVTTLALHEIMCSPLKASERKSKL